MKKFLFFQAGSNDAACYPVEALRGFDTSAGKVHFYFQSQRLTNVVTGEIVDMVESGIIDPVLVTKTALKNSISVVITIISADCVISNIRINEGS